MNQDDQAIKLATTNRKPSTKFSDWDPLLLALPSTFVRCNGDDHRFIGNPLYNVMTIAPPTHIIVPSTFALPAELLIPIFSNL